MSLETLARRALCRETSRHIGDVVVVVVVVGMLTVADDVWVSGLPPQH